MSAVANPVQDDTLTGECGEVARNRSGEQCNLPHGHAGIHKHIIGRGPYGRAWDLGERVTGADGTSYYRLDDGHVRIREIARRRRANPLASAASRHGGKGARARRAARRAGAETP